MFIGIDSAAAPIRCYVYRPSPDAAPTCWGPRDSRHAPRATSGAVIDRLGGGEAAVSQLVQRIIQVESGGRADARNPLSTATGLGQFIDSTWLRMMRTYRPDLTAQMTNAELLTLRTNPEIAREMVGKLASEGAAFLRARGHTITAGRLYLAHFLGMEGAHLALSADPATDLLSLFGAAVIRANPFLEDQARALHRRLKPYRRIQLRSLNRIEHSFEEHERIVQALLSGNGKDAEQALWDHVTIQADRFHDFLAGLERGTQS